MAQDLHRIPDGARGIGVARKLLIHDAQDYALAVSPGTVALTHAGGGAANGRNLVSTEVKDLGDWEVDVVLVFCAERGGGAEDDELLFSLTCSYPVMVIL